MSTILKALRRLEHDRAAEASPSLEAAVLAEGAPAAPASGRRRATWIAGALAAAAVGAGGVLLLERGGVLHGNAPAAGISSVASIPRVPPATDAGARTAEPVSPGAVAAAPALPATGAASPAQPPIVAAPQALPTGAPAPVALGTTPDVAARPPAAPIDASGADAVAAAQAELDAADAAGEAAAVPDAADPRALAPATSARPAPPAAAANVPAPGMPSPLGAPAAGAPARAASAPLAPARDASTPIRVARAEPLRAAPKASLPGRAAAGIDTGAIVAEPVSRGGSGADEEVRSAQPRKRIARAEPAGVSVLRTVWHPKPERRTALLEAPGDSTPREYHEGDRIGALTVLRIEPSAVVFERGGVEIREKLADRP